MITIKPDHLILGTWIDVFEYVEMEFIVALQNEEIVVSAVDKRDIEDEEGEVDNIFWDGDWLHFDVYWCSTGNSAKCRFLLISPNRVEFVYTNTEGLKQTRKQLELQLNNSSNPITGEWIDSRAYGSDVTYFITYQNEQFVISAIDFYDNEQPKIYDTYWDGEALNFSMYWELTGRFMKCQFTSISPDQLLFIYTYTERCTLIRKSTEILEDKRCW